MYIWAYWIEDDELHVYDRDEEFAVSLFAHTNRDVCIYFFAYAEPVPLED
jgi:hypothetical protein